MLKWLKMIIIAVVGGPLIVLGLWYAISFLPHLGELKSIASRGNESIRSIEHVFYPLVVAGESKKGIRSYATRQAYWTLVHQKTPGRMLIWHTNNMLWYGASYMHFNEHQILGLWVECALSHCENGLKDVAQKYFGKALIDLSEKEQAELVAVMRHPTKYAPGTEFGKKRTNEILEKAKNLGINFQESNSKRRAE